jgi:hypothetical protein
MPKFLLVTISGPAYHYLVGKMASSMQGFAEVSLTYPSGLPAGLGHNFTAVDSTRRD